MKSPKAKALIRAEDDAHDWLDAVAAEMGESQRHRAYSAFRAVMHAVRRSLPYADVMSIAESLPAVLRGASLEGWHPAGAATREPFLARVAEPLLGVARMPPETAARAVVAVLRRRGGIPASLEALRPPDDAPSPPPRAAEEVREDIRTALERAQAEGVPPEDLPELRDDLERPSPGRPRRTADTDVLQTSLQKTHAWVRELDEALRFGDPDLAFKALCAVLQTLRDRLSRDEAFHLASQLPMALAGFFLDARPDASALKERSRGEFLARVSRKLPESTDFRPEEAARAVFALLARRVTEGELEDVRGRLPAPVRSLWPPEHAASRQQTVGGRSAPRASSSTRRSSRARARKAKREVRSTLARARARGVPERDLPVLVPRKTRRSGREGR